ncbi:hypothetical protein [Enterococcus sp. AZ103]|uniref:hypothetical protein n=1 Tax=Enterococcus sp. AZ103 TaxID=2774628 RepID=UPI003F294633
MNINEVSLFALFGILITTFFFLLALSINRTNGLFFSRLPKQFLKDSNNPQYELEREFGKKFVAIVFKIFPPIFLGFVFILILSFLFHQ